MLIDETFDIENIDKIIKKINLLHRKGKIDKMKSAIRELDSFTKNKDSNECKIVMNIFSTLMEDYPDIITDNIVKRLNELISSSEPETRLNSIIMYGTKLMERIENEKEKISGDEIDEFIDLLDDSVPEIQGNIIFFIENFPEEYYDYILPKLNTFLNILDEAANSEVTEALLFIIGKVWDKSLDIKISVFNTLIEKYIKTHDREKTKLIINFLMNGFEELKNFVESNKKFSDDDLLKFIKNRGPMVKIYNIEKIAKSESMNPREVQKQFDKMEGDEIIFRFMFTGKRKHFIEIEIIPLIRKLENKRVKVEDLIHLFGHEELDSISLLNLLIKKLVKAKYIKGYLSKSYFYSYEYIKDTLMRDIKQTGKVDLDKHAKLINYDFIVKIAEDINRETKFKGIFNKNKSHFFTLNSIIKEIEKICIKESMFDLGNYYETYSPDDFKLIEKECKEAFFTEYHDNTNWLTNIGYTRLASKLKDAQTIGYITLFKIAEELEMSIDLAREIVEVWLEAKPGLWDNSNTIYYFTKYIKIRLGKFDKSVEEEEKQRLVSELADELNVEPDEIMKKLNEEIEEVIHQIKSKPSIDINAYCRVLGFKRDQFIKFVNNLKIEYLVIGKEMVFDQRRINKKRKEVNNEILKRSSREYGLRIDELSKWLKFSQNMISEIIEKYQKEGKIKGILIDEELFLTEKGITQRLIDNRDIITMETVFPERELTEEEQNLTISLLEKLINSGELIGVYNEDEKEFHSEEAWDIVQYSEEKSNAEDMAKQYKKFMIDTFNKIRDIYLNKDDIKLGDIKRKDYLLKRIMGEWGNWERFLIKQIEKTETSFNSLEDAGDLTFGDVLEAEETAAQIDGTFLMDEFTKWKTILQNVEQKIDNVGALKKKVKENPNNKELLNELQDLYENLHFFDKDI
ncbi:MAG: hypothetical protein GY870_14010 [archaeon]|nr:hypothetical protein [archaeon]